MRRRPGRPLAAAPGGFLHLSLLTSLRRRRPSLQAHAQLLLLGLPLPAAAASRLLRPHLRSGHPLASLRLFLRILRHRDPSSDSTASQEAVPNSYSLSAALAACSRHAYPTPGFSIHAFLLKSGFASDLFAANSLLHFYSSFDLHDSTHKLFDEMPVRDSVSFNTLICSYVRSGCIQDALGVFRNMAEAGFRMDGWTVTALLGACAGLGDLLAAKAVHGIARRVLKQKLFDSGEVVIALVDMYVKCGAVQLARRVLDLSGEKARNVRVWTVMIAGHARLGEINMARRLFDELPDKDLVAWTVMIGAFVQAGRYNEALGLFKEMEATGLEADEVTIVTVLSACVQHSRIDLGRRLHRLVDHNGLIGRNARLATSFVHMYAKHGCLQKAMDVFCGVSDEFKSVDLFNAMINGFAHHGFGEKSISLFDEMELLGLHPDEITFVSVLCACSHSGLVQQGFQIFNSMEEKYGIKPDIKHYACMADLLGRVGKLEDAYRFIQNMPFKANHVVWSSLLRACIFHRNDKIGKIAEKQLCEFDIAYKHEKLTLSELFSHEKKKEPAARMRNVIRHMSEHIHSQLSEEQICEFEITCKPDKVALSDLFSDEKGEKPAARVREAINNKSEHRDTQLAEKLEFDSSCKPEKFTLYHLFSDKKQKEKSAKARKAIKPKSENSCTQLAEKQLLELLRA